MPLVPEIIVRGTRLIQPEPTFARPPAVPPGSTPSAGEGDVGPRFRDPPDMGFVPPPVPPQLIPEIVVRGTTPARPPVGIGTAPNVPLLGLFAVIGGTLVANILRDVSQRRLDEAGELALRPVPAGPDSPLQTLPTFDSVITVTARRPSLFQTVFPQGLTFAPQPQPLITPDFDPSILVPILPRVQPLPAALPTVDIPRPTSPQPTRTPANVPTRFFPATIPTIRPTRTTPFISPQRSPATTPQVSPRPATQPSPGLLPGVSPAVSPAVGPQIATNPLTQSRTGLLQSLRRRLQRQPFAQATPLAAGGQCPPCPPCRKDEKAEEARSQCYKKLVKEGLFPSMDRSFEWVEIDCLTGREL